MVSTNERSIFYATPATALCSKIDFPILHLMQIKTPFESKKSLRIQNDRKFSQMCPMI